MTLCTQELMYKLYIQMFSLVKNVIPHYVSFCFSVAEEQRAKNQVCCVKKN